MLYTQSSLQAQAEEFLDPNKWSSDGTVALSDYAFSKDGSLMAYSTGRSDSAYFTSFVRGCLGWELESLISCSSSPWGSMVCD